MTSTLATVEPLPSGNSKDMLGKNVCEDNNIQYPTPARILFGSEASRWPIKLWTGGLQFFAIWDREQDWHQRLPSDAIPGQ